MEPQTQPFVRVLSAITQHYDTAMFAMLVVFAALAFTVGGIFMKLSDGLSKVTPTLVLIGLFLLGACLQTLAMKREDLAVTYLVVLGLEAILAFAFGVFVFGESSSVGRVAGVALVGVGIGFLRYAA